MTEYIAKIYETNISLLGAVDKAVLFFREGRYEEALGIVAQSGESINLVAEAVLSDRTYFDRISTDSVTQMLQGILEVSQKGDYVLLADLYEMQLANFIGSVQEIILNREQYLVYDEGRYRENIGALKTVLREMIEERDDLNSDEQKRFRINLNAGLDDPFDAEGLLKKGYTLEFTSSGLMTVAAPFRNDRIYLHSNYHTENESFLLAKSWYDSKVDEYLVYGLGLGYHIEQLHMLAPQKRIIVYENDLNIFRLFCAFGGECRILTEENVFFVYDDKMTLLERKIKRCRPICSEGAQLLYENDNLKKTKVCVHYPSYRRTKGCDALNKAVPWSSMIEQL